MRRGATAFPQISNPASEIRFEYRSIGNDWQTISTIPNAVQEISWDDWEVFLEDLPDEGGRGGEIRISIETRIPANSKGAHETVALWHKSYKEVDIRSGIIETGNAERRRKMSAATLKKLPDGEISISGEWVARVDDLLKAVTIETVVVASRQIDISPGVGVSPGTVVATTNNVIVKTKRDVPPGNSLFDYQWVDFSEATNVFSARQLFAIVLEDADRPTIVINSSIKDLRTVLTVNDDSIANFKSIVKARMTLEKALAVMIAESIGPSIAMRLLELAKEASDDLLTLEILETLDFDEIVQSLEPNLLTVAEAWSSWLTPNGGSSKGSKQELSATCREICEIFVSKGVTGFQEFLHDQLPRQLRAALGAEDFVSGILGFADIDNLLPGIEQSIDSGEEVDE